MLSFDIGVMKFLKVLKDKILDLFKFKKVVSLRYKVSILVITTLTITALAIFLYFFIRVNSIIEARFSKSAEIIINNFSNNSRQAVIIESIFFLEKASQNIMAEKEVLYTLIYKKKGIPPKMRIIFKSCKHKERRYLPITYRIINNNINTIEKDIINIEGVGKVLDIKAPVIDNETGEVIGAVRAGISRRSLNREKLILYTVTILITFSIIIVSLIISLHFSNTVTEPLTKIIVAMKSIVETGSLDKRLELATTTNEIEILIKSFNKMLSKLKEAQEGLIEKERIEKELAIAREIQLSLVPSDVPKETGFNFSVYYTPAEKVGGDYYDFIFTNNGVGLVIGDVSGHGIAAALLMAVVRTVLRTLISDNNMIRPAELMESANNILSTSISATSGNFITLLYAEINNKDKKMVLSNAGHYPPLIFQRKQNKIKEIDVPGLPLGIEKSIKFDSFNIELEKGDYIIFFTDGIIEARNKENIIYGLENLKSKILEFSDKKDVSPAIIMNSIVSEINKYDRNDDQTLIIVEVK